MEDDDTISVELPSGLNVKIYGGFPETTRDCIIPALDIAINFSVLNMEDQIALRAFCLKEFIQRMGVPASYHNREPEFKRLNPVKFI